MTQVDDAREGTAALPSKPVLVVGAACSGTTWVAETLARIADIPYVHEPDNPLLEPYAVVARSGLGAYPAIRSDADAPDEYTRLWDVALGRRHRLLPARRARRLWRRVPVSEKLGELDPLPGDAESAADRATDELSRRARTALRLARPSPRGRVPTRRVVSSVDAPLALDWMVGRYVPEVVFVRRHPLDVVASRMRELVNVHGGDVFVDERSIDEHVVRWRIPRRPSAGHSFARLVWLVGFEMSAYQEVADARHEVLVVDYKRLCTDPQFEFRRLLTNLELVWRSRDEGLETPSVRDVDDQRGSGRRPVAHTAPARLSPEQTSLARNLLSLFPIARHYHDLQPPSAASGR